MARVIKTYENLRLERYNMKTKIVLLFSIVILLFVGCETQQYTAIKNTSLDKYHYVYIIPTGSKTGSNGVHGNQYGVYGGEVKSTNPQDIIAGYLMRKGFSILPSIDPELKSNTLIVSYGETGKHAVFILGYSISVVLQFRDASTHEIVCQSEAEGMGETEADDIYIAIIKALDAIFQ